MDIKRSSEINHQLPEGRSVSDYPYAMSDKIFHTDQVFLYSEKILPGKKASAPHSHTTIDEVIYVTEGEPWAFEGSESHLIKQGDFVCFRSSFRAKHYLENKSDQYAEFLVFRCSMIKDDTAY